MDYNIVRKVKQIAHLVSKLLLSDNRGTMDDRRDGTLTTSTGFSGVPLPKTEDEGRKTRLASNVTFRTQVPCVVCVTFCLLVVSPPIPRKGTLRRVPFPLFFKQTITSLCSVYPTRGNEKRTEEPPTQWQIPPSFFMGVRRWE